MSLLETLGAIRAKSDKYVGKLDMVLDVVQDIAVAAAGVPVARDDDGNLIEKPLVVYPEGAGLDAAQSEMIMRLEQRIAALEARLADDAQS